MTGKQINLVRTSFEKIKHVSEEAAVLFYARLFELDPSLRRLFKTDIREQGRKFMEMLEIVVNGLDGLTSCCLRHGEELGARHAGYGVEDKLRNGGTALLWTARQGSGRGF